jgi:hypothetical protein
MFHEIGNRIARGSDWLNGKIQLLSTTTESAHQKPEPNVTAAQSEPVVSAAEFKKFYEMALAVEEERNLYVEQLNEALDFCGVVSLAADDFRKLINSASRYKMSDRFYTIRFENCMHPIYDEHLRKIELDLGMIEPEPETAASRKDDDTASESDDGAFGDIIVPVAQNVNGGVTAVPANPPEQRPSTTRGKSL